ncbi:MAG TPA: hypothetical protein VEK85_11625, partial [Gemmatimonadales bacterium]|nr:hypothetical protein [Gemmatimonadales bacterium]
MAIKTPSEGTAVVVGATFRVAGTTSPRTFTKPDGSVENEIPPSRVTYRLDGGASQLATALDAKWSAWEAKLRLTTPGPHTIVAVAQWSPPAGHTAEDTVTVNAVATPLNLIEPEPGGAVSIVDFPVVVTASHPNGIIGDSVRVRADAQDWVTLGQSGGRWQGRLRLNSDRVPAGGRQVPVDLQATSGDGLLHERSVQITAVDEIPPEVLDFTPHAGAKLPGTAVGTTVDVVVRAQDPGQGRLTSGIAAVETQVDGRSSLAKPTADPWIWRDRVFVPGADDHTITVRARDASDHPSAPVSHRVVVTSPADLRDLSRQTYLQDLLGFATEHLWTRAPSAPDAAAEPPYVTAGQLGEALGQD